MSVIVDIARSYIGQKEIPNNQGFVDTSFDAKMRSVGFVNGYSWCAIFAHLVFKEALSSVDYQKVKKLFSVSALATFNNFKNANYAIKNFPSVGDLVIWQHGNSTLGHEGIVSSVTPDYKYMHISGNTNSQGGREGIEVAEKRGSYNKNTSGLNIKGFITIKSI